MVVKLFYYKYIVGLKNVGPLTGLIYDLINCLDADSLSIRESMYE
jgi:hypothetical protein